MAKKKAATRKKTTRKVNKSAAIRKFLADHPDVGPTEAAARLTKQGIAVTASYVSGIKTSQKSKSAKKKRRTTKKQTQGTSPVQDVMQAGQLLYQAVDLVMKAGAKEAKTLVDMAGKMVDRMSDKEK